MSTPTGGPRRRKIAGERRPGRPAPGSAGTRITLSKAPEAPPAAAVTPVPAALRNGDAPRAASTTPTAPTAPRRGRLGAAPDWWGSTPVVLALGLLLVALLLAVVLGATGHLGNASVAEAHAAKADASAWEEGSSAPATAERAAATILAYDYRSLPATEKEAVQYMTSEYASTYSDTFERVVVPAAKQQKARVTADVQASSVVRATPGRVRVLLYVDQTTVSAANQGPQVALNRVEMVMVRRSGSWLVDAITSY